MVVCGGGFILGRGGWWVVVGLFWVVVRFWVVDCIFRAVVGNGVYFLGGGGYILCDGWCGWVCFGWYLVVVGGGTVYNSSKNKSRQNFNILRTKRASKMN